MNLTFKTLRYNDDEHRNLRSFYINLIGDSKDVIPRVSALRDYLHEILESDCKSIDKQRVPYPFRKASQRSIQERIDELKGVKQRFMMSQLENNFNGYETVKVARSLARYFESAGISVTGENEISIHDCVVISFSDGGSVISTNPDYNVKDVNILPLLAAFIDQDFGIVVKRGNKQVYIYEGSKFEKTPKHIETGYNNFLGENFIEWHRRIPNWGNPLSEMFLGVDEVFRQNKADMFLVDLRGRNLYSCRSIIVRRYERNYAVPLFDIDDSYVGMSVFADVFFSSINESRYPQEGGKFLSVDSSVDFNNHFMVIKHAGFRDHPCGMRNTDGSPKKTS